MKLWLLTQDENDGYDTFDSCVVAAVDDKSAVDFHPQDQRDIDYGYWNGVSAWENEYHQPWANSPDGVIAKLLCDGYDGEPGIIIASYNAG